MQTKLRERRIKAEPHQGVFCRRADLNRNQYSQIERGTYKPSPTLRDKIARALGVDWKELFNADGWPELAEVTNGE